MPFYDYKCGGCGRQFEVSHSMSGKPAGLKCQFCASDNLQRVFHPVGLMRNSGETSSHSSSGGSCSSCGSGSCGSCHH